MDSDIVHMVLRNFLNSWDRLVEIAIQNIKKTLRKHREDDCDQYLAVLVQRTTQNSSGISASELLMKRKLRTLVPSLNVNVHTKTKLKKPWINQSREIQTLNTSNTVPYQQNNNWEQTGTILNKNNLPWSYTLLNNKDTVIQRNRLHLEKMNSNFIKTEDDNDMTKSKI